MPAKSIRKANIESAAAVEVNLEDTTPKEPFTFEVNINGQKVELEDRWNKPGVPAAIGFINYSPEVYAPAVLDAIIGAEQLLELMRLGASMEELAAVVPAWSKAVQGTAKN